MYVALCCACLQLWNTTSKPKWSSSARWQIPTNFNTQPPSSTSSQWSQPPTPWTSIVSSHLFKIASMPLRARDLGGTQVKFWICFCLWECFARRPVSPDVPPEIAKKRAIIKPRNYDNNCFQYSILAAIYPVTANARRCSIYTKYLCELDMTGIKTPLSVVHPEIRVPEPVHFRQCFDIRKERFNSRIHLKVFKRTSSSHKFVVTVQMRQVSLHPDHKSFSSRIWQDT